MDPAEFLMGRVVVIWKNKYAQRFISPYDIPQALVLVYVDTLCYTVVDVCVVFGVMTSGNGQ